MASAGARGAPAAASLPPRGVALVSTGFELSNPTRGEGLLDVDLPRSDAMTAQFFSVASFADVILSMLNKAI